ncbi:MAG: DUF928 domain-containing protein [Leptolyngbyaceae cyanobacterium SL_7_1]|nr:DUF928 domain-containing protein [Leptolyngbyaceae cyanobacterium SL_7_1]
MSRILSLVLRTALPLSLLGTITVVGLPDVSMAQQFVPPDRGLPGRREGGGTRGSCLRGQVPLTALMPASNFAQTTKTSPTFFWYVPPFLAETAEFVLLDEHDNELYHTTVQLVEDGGVVSLSLPTVKDASGTDVSLLNEGQDYHWYFSLICDPDDRSGDVFAEGWIQRVQPTLALTNRLAIARTEREQAAVYAEAGIWHDALTTLAELRRSQPSNSALLSNWITLLESVDLENIASEPIISCCEPVPSEQSTIPSEQSLVP